MSAEHGNRLYLTVWGGLLLLTLSEVMLAYMPYMHAHTTEMLVTLLALSFVKTGLIVAYFMHLRFERLSLFLTLVPATLFCISMMGFFFPDSLRILELH